MLRMAPEGWSFVAPGLGLTGLAVLGATLIPSAPSWMATCLWALSLALAILTGFALYFFRDPPRSGARGDDLVLAPADGRIVHITPVEDPSGFMPPAKRISIFLSVFNVHVQRAPLSGRVALRSYRPGRFDMAWKEKASEDNEQATLGIEAGPHRILVRQIAGWVARRIVTDPKEGDPISQGSRIGLIRFGSRVDLSIPVDWELTCAVGDRLKGGETIVARIPRPAAGSEA